MKKGLSNDITSFRAAIKSAAKVARRIAFRKGLPVAISRDGKIVFVYKDKSEVIVNSSQL